MGRPIHAIIGVRHDGPSTWYVRRSSMMANYPNVWSLPSIQYDPEAFADGGDLEHAAGLFSDLSDQRLGGVPIQVDSLLTSGSSDMNPMGVDVHLRLYRISLGAEPVLEPSYYVDAEWMSPRRYEEASAGQACGLCLRLWSDFAWLSGITDRPFVARPAS